jgi:hypothetical protein
VTSTIPLAATYPDARARFLHEARDAGATVDSYLHPLTGLDGEELAIDVAQLGPDDAVDVVLVVSGTHGVEGYCGSALQSRWLESCAADRPGDVSVVCVHGLNPFGFSWVRRTNEDNVDLNRNFVDWDQPLPPNPGYDEIADLLVPREWTDEERARTDGLLLEMLAERGLESFQQTISGGQYAHADGVFYGGDGPVWSQQWLRAWSAARLGGARRVAIIDLHTGLGPWGEGELITSDALGSPAHRRASEWWGQVTSMVGGDSVSAVLSGDWLDAAPALVPHAEVTSAALEFGTIDPVSVLQALRADAWLHSHGDPTSPDAAQVRAQVRQAFADDDPAWLDAVWARFLQVVEQTFVALSD